LHRITHPATHKTLKKKNAPCVIVFNRDEVEKRDLSRLLESCGPSIPGVKLRALQGQVRFTFHGYDEEGELYEIPAVRDYCRKATEEWGCWLFYADLSSDCLRLLLSCWANSLVARKEEGSKGAVLHIDRDTVIDFLQAGVPVAAHLLDKAGRSQSQGVQRLKAAARHLGIG